MLYYLNEKVYIETSMNSVVDLMSVIGKQPLPWWTYLSKIAR